MDGISKITARIAGDSKKEAEEILAAAKKEAEALAYDYRAQSEALEKELAAQNQAEAAVHKERRIGVAQLEARKLKLSAKQDMISAAFDAALDELHNLPEDDMVELLARLAAQASRNGSEKIVLSTQDHSRFGKKVAGAANKLLEKEGRIGSLTLSESPRGLSGGGLMLADGDVEVNATFSSIIGALRGEISADVAKVLF